MGLQLLERETQEMLNVLAMNQTVLCGRKYPTRNASHATVEEHRRSPQGKFGVDMPPPSLGQPMRKRGAQLFTWVCEEAPC